MKLLALVLIISPIFFGCNERDIGPRVHEPGRPTVWEPESRKVAGTRFEFYVGPAYYQDEPDRNPDYYRIEVNLNKGDGSSPIYFARNFRIEDLPEGFLSKKIDEIASFDQERLAVVFQIGDEEFIYKLPKED